MLIHFIFCLLQRFVLYIITFQFWNHHHMILAIRLLLICSYRLLLMWQISIIIVLPISSEDGCKIEMVDCIKQIVAKKKEHRLCVFIPVPRHDQLRQKPGERNYSEAENRIDQTGAKCSQRKESHYRHINDGTGLTTHHSHAIHLKF